MIVNRLDITRHTLNQACNCISEEMLEEAIRDITERLADESKARNMFQ